jgi:hypothetical protein
MGIFGFSTEPSAGGDFTPIVKYDSRSGRIFRVDRVSTGDGFVSENIDITATFKCVADFDNIETGWMLFATGVAPSMTMVKLSSVDESGKGMPARPSEQHKQGIRFMLKLHKTCSGDKPVREIAGQAKAFLSGIETVVMDYRKQKDQHKGMLPVITMLDAKPVKTGTGAQSSTNYRPTFRIEAWVKRPEDLIQLKPSMAPVDPLPPTTGHHTVPPANNLQSPQMADDDFG